MMILVFIDFSYLSVILAAIINALSLTLTSISITISTMSYSYTLLFTQLI